MESKYDCWCRISILLLLCLCSYQQGSAQHWSFDGKNPLEASYKKGVLELRNVKSKVELTEGIIGKGLRTDGYSTYLRAAIKSQPSVLTCTGWFALESFPTDTAAFFAVKDADIGVSVSANIDRFGEIILGMGKGAAYSYLSTGHFVERYKWYNIALGIGDSNQGIWVNGKKLDIDLSPVTIPKKPTEVLVGKDFREKLLGQMDLTSINGIIDEIKLVTGTFSHNETWNGIEPLVKKVPLLAIPKERFNSDFSRPKYHLLPAANWTNETHGLIYYKGLYHIFNQKNASNLALRQINWGHFSSPDLVNWTEHKPALSPEKGYDENGIWSGHVILNDKGIPMISYTAGGPRMGVALAFPKDSTLKEWIKYKQNPVIAGQPEGLSRTDLRDTYVWKDGEKWYMIVGFGVVEEGVEKGALLLYSSDDLKSWKFLHTLFEGDPEKDNSGIFWEMPVFKKIRDKYVLLVNKVPHNGVPAQALYWVGDFVNERFIPENPLPKNLEVINRLLSPSVAEDKDGLISAIAIIPDEISGNAAYLQGWSHLYSIPRVWDLLNGEIVQSPHPVLKSLRDVANRVIDTTVISGKSVELSSGQQQYELLAQIEPNKATRFGFVLHKAPDNSEYTRIYYDGDLKEIVVDQRHSSRKRGIPLLVRKDAFALDKDKPVTFHVFVDGSVVEIFINNKYAFTTRIFPSKQSSNQAEVFSEGDSIDLRAESWTLRPSRIDMDF